MGAQNLFESWVKILFEPLAYLGGNPTLTYFLIGGMFAAVAVNTLYHQLCGEINLIGEVISYVFSTVICVLFWGAIPMVVIPVAFVCCMIWLLNDLAEKYRSNVWRKVK